MMEYLKGRLVAKSPSEVVLEVGGVAFAARIALSTFDKLPAVGEEAKVWTKLFVRDEQVELFGFSSRDERWVFDELISISGVGPRLALTLLSGMSAELVRETIAAGDAARLKSVRGIGAKIADRIVLELGKKFSQASTEWTPSSLSSNGNTAVVQARQALLALGLTQAEVDKSLESARNRNIEDAESLIKFVLHKG
ncbi:Holliday junction branch migration protein RuvA [bacterium]|nr:Holliday junction branch migration protein RuvA [bacterium]